MKKRAAEEKRSTYATGGGPPLKEPMSHCDLKLKAILHDAQVSGLEAVYDSNFIIEKSHNAGKENNVSSYIEMEQLESPSCSWQNYHPGKLKKPINEKLNNSPYRKAKNVTSWSKLADVKAQWCEEKAKREIELMEEEYQSRLSFWEKKKLLEKKEYELRMKLMLEKHEKYMQKENRF